MTKRLNPAPGWQFWVREPLWLRHLLVVGVIGLAALLVLASALSPGSRTDSISAADGHGPINSSGEPAAPSPTVSPTPPALVRVGEVDPSTDGLDPDQLEQASALGKWLTQWAEVDFEHTDSAELRDRAADYQKTGLGGKKVRTLLRDAADLIDSGEAAAEGRRYQTALKDYGQVTQKLKAIPPLLRADFRKAEKATGARISPHADEWYDGYDDLFPVATETEEVTVIAWIDGDTVETSAGRVRLIGVDTPEMTDQCSRAQSAMKYAELLAPVGSPITLTNPESVKDIDRYDRLLRYVQSDGGSDDKVTDIGYSLILSAVAVARYDSRDGYQWHPRENLYRGSSDTTVESDQCQRNGEKAAFVLAATLATDDDTQEYWRQRILGKVLAAPYRSAKKHLPKGVAETRETHEDEDRREREARQREREQQNSGSNDSGYDSDDDSDDGGSGSYPGYSGPRCYAPGGKTWKPC